MDLARRELRADCANCVALCCVGPAFSASTDFALDKAAGQPCPNLGADFRCGIHAKLRQSGFPGCVVYDCFGAGQRVAQVMGGQVMDGQAMGTRDWRHIPRLASQMFEMLTVLRQLHELLWYLSEASALAPDRELRGRLDFAIAQTRELAGGEPDDLAGLDVNGHRRDVNALLSRTSELLRSGAGRRVLDRRGADLIGKDLRRTDLRGANLRGAYLIGARLRGVDLALADLTGADLRGADLRGADLRRTLFLTEPQVRSAVGDAGTRLPAHLIRPAHWPT